MLRVRIPPPRSLTAGFLCGAADHDIDTVPIGDTFSAAKPTKRRRTADPKNKSTKNQHFYFVDQNSSSKEKRAHVMRHHVQEKRKHHKTLRGPLSIDPGAKNAEHHRSGSSSAAGQPSDVTTSVWDTLLWSWA